MGEEGREGGVCAGDGQGSSRVVPQSMAKRMVTIRDVFPPAGSYPVRAAHMMQGSQGHLLNHSCHTSPI